MLSAVHTSPLYMDILPRLLLSYSLRMAPGSCPGHGTKPFACGTRRVANTWTRCGDIRCVPLPLHVRSVYPGHHSRKAVPIHRGLGGWATAAAWHIRVPRVTRQSWHNKVTCRPGLPAKKWSNDLRQKNESYVNYRFVTRKRPYGRKYIGSNLACISQLSGDPPSIAPICAPICVGAGHRNLSLPIDRVLTFINLALRSGLPFMDTQ